MNLALKEYSIRRLPLRLNCHKKRLIPRLNPPPDYKSPKVQIPDGFFHFCEVCGRGVGLVECPECDGAGLGKTRSGGAGMAGVQGWARCKVCKGMGIIPCPLCVGCQVELRPPSDPCEDFPNCME